MKLNRIAISGVRKLRGRTLIERMAPGVTVIAGDNEEGKSTLLHAVKADFFEKRGGQLGGSLIPFDGGGPPAVEVDFEHGGKTCKLRKQFRPTPNTRLCINGESLAGDAAEDALRQMLDFAPAGAPRGERGVWSLFWADQGTAIRFGTRPAEISGHAHSTLLDALSGGARADRLMTAANKQRKQYFTEKEDRIKDVCDISRFRADIESCSEEIEGAQAEVESRREALSRLADVEAQILKRRRENTIKNAERRVEAAREEVNKVGQLKSRFEAAEAEYKHAAEKAKNVQAEAERRMTGEDELCVANKELERLTKIADQARENRSGLEESAATAKKKHERAESDFKMAAKELEAAILALECAKARSNLTKAVSAKKRRDSAAKRAGEITVNDEVLGELRSKSQTANDARLQLEAAAATLTFLPEQGGRIWRDGKEAETGEPILVTDKAVFSLERFGKVEISPGGKDLPTLRAEMNRAESALEAALTRVKVQSFDEAEQLANKRRQLTGKASEAELEALQKTAADMGTDGGNDTASVAESEARVNGAKERRDAAERPLQDLKDKDEAERAKLSQAHGFAARAEADVDAQKRRVKQFDETLSKSRETQSDEALRSASGTARANRDKAKSKRDAAKEELAEAKPEQIARDMQEAQSALAQLQGASQADEREANQLRGQLKKGSGADERLSDLDQRRKLLETNLQFAEREAAAARLLYRALEFCRGKAAEAVFGQIRNRMGPYLRIVFGECEPLFDEQKFDLCGIRRDGQDEDYESLSIGARDQISMLIRLAFAEALADKGEPPVVILDDVMVNADNIRREKMLRALRKAAEKIQIIVLTCREHDYQELNAPVKRLLEMQQ